MAVSSADVSKGALGWLQKSAKQKDRPFFLFLHYFDPHFRYKNHEEFPFADSYSGQLKPGMSLERLTRLRHSYSEADLRYLKNLFREEVAHTDAYIGKILTFLKDNDLSSNTIVVMTADHGEEFMEHGNLGHTQTLFKEITRIPFLISFPGIVKPGKRRFPVNQLDVLPTLAGLSGLPAQKQWQGRDLSRFLQGEKTEPASKPFFAEVAYRKVSTGGPIFPHLSAVWLNNYKLIIDRGRNKTLLYDIEQDPAEQTNLAKTSPAKLQELHALLKKFEEDAKRREGENAPEQEEFSADEVEKLKSLGYL
jgi:arylsulfatase A-like enzyme